MIDLEIVTRCANCAECEQMEDQLYCGKSGCFVKPDHFCGDGHSVFAGGKEVEVFDIINAVRRKYNIRCDRCKLAVCNDRGMRWCRMHLFPTTHYFMCLDFDPRTEEDEEWK